ncbi:tetratricopeptide repeat protein [Actinokineospora enzanensis]|uniref:tetratricopeptide repeat protein n=1 Tax=Actinokineospora enzanensis TaxID=155975 RepID=UPI00039EF4BB|nr:tetratricopeptide repeat protein [Actinokineospora enzanensis]
MDNRPHGAHSTVLHAGAVYGNVHLHQTPSTRPPDQLPAVTRHFVGRAPETDHLTTATDQARVCVIDGPPGVGKTTLAVHWGKASTAFPDGKLYMDLKGFAPSGDPVDPAQAALMLLSALRIPPDRIPADLGTRTALFRDLVHEQAILVILDNARDSDQVLPLLPGDGRCFTVITSRRRLSALSALYGADHIHLPPLEPTDSRTLITGYIGQERATAEKPAIERIARLCAGLPLALSIAAATAAQRPTAALAWLVSDLADERTRLSALSLDAPAADMSAVLSWSYYRLTAPAARLFRLLGLHPGDTVSADLAAVLHTDSRSALAELVSHNLVTESATGYRVHDLVRAYAKERCMADEPEDAREAAVTAMLDHYLHTAFRADRLLNSHRKPIPLPPGPGAPVIADYAAAIEWFTAEIDNLLAAARLAAATRHRERAWQLPWTAVNFLYLHGRWQDSVAAQRDALGAARALGDTVAVTRTLRGLARAHNELGECEQARDCYSAVLDLPDADPNTLADTLNGRAGSHLRLGDLGAAQADATEALRRYTALDDTIGRASTVNLLGRIATRRGDHPGAVALHGRALPLFRAKNDRYGQANALAALALALRGLGRLVPAATCQVRAIAEQEALGTHFHLADTHRELAATLELLGEPTAARAHRERAQRILAELDR